MVDCDNVTKAGKSELFYSGLVKSKLSMATSLSNEFRTAIVRIDDKSPITLLVGPVQGAFEIYRSRIRVLDGPSVVRDPERISEADRLTVVH